MNFAKGNEWMSEKKYAEGDGSGTRKYLVAWMEGRSSSMWVCPSSRPMSSSGATRRDSVAY